MGASRETQNIFFHIRMKNYKRAIFLIKHFDKTTYGDTFGASICKFLKSHKIKQHEIEYSNKVEYSCTRCNRWIDEKEVLKQKLNEIL